jgi:hypothetical protein
MQAYTGTPLDARTKGVDDTMEVGRPVSIVVGRLEVIFVDSESNLGGQLQERGKSGRGRGFVCQIKMSKISPESLGWSQRRH